MHLLRLTIRKAFYASSIITIVVLALAKASVTMLVISIKPLRPVLIGCYVVLGMTGAWMVAGIFALASQCDMPRPWVLGPESCGDQYAVQIGLATVNIVTDLVIITLAYFMMRTTQVQTSKKWTVVGLFGLRVA